MAPKSKIILDLGSPDLAIVLRAIEQTADYVGYYKIDINLVCSSKICKILDWCKSCGGKVFYDIKLNDTDDAVAQTIKTICDKVDLVTMHAFAGINAMKLAVANAGSCKVLAAPMVSSMKVSDLEDIGIAMHGGSDDDCMGTFVWKLSKAAYSAGVHGFVCQAHELKWLDRRQPDDAFLKVVTNVNPAWAPQFSNERSVAPADAIRAGADMVVINHSVMQPQDGLVRVEAIRRISDEISSVA